MASRTENICTLLLNFQGFLAGLLLLTVIVESDWRVLLSEQSTAYVQGITGVGIWRMCFPPTNEGPGGYSVHCCHKFGIFEKFFPVEMKIGQLSIPIAFCLTTVGLIFFVVAHEWRIRSFDQARRLFLAAGIFYLISSICIFVPISWNVYSVSQKKLIPFPSSFRVPKSVEQITGSAVTEGYISAICLFISGTYITAKSLSTSDKIVPISPT